MGIGNSIKPVESNGKVLERVKIKAWQNEGYIRNLYGDGRGVFQRQRYIIMYLMGVLSQWISM